VLFIYDSGQQQIDVTKNAGKSMTISTTMRMWRCDAGAHRPMKHNQGFTRSQWMRPSGECSHRIAAVAAMVNDFE